jgi:serine/threonine protein kinase
VPMDKPPARTRRPRRRQRKQQGGTVPTDEPPSRTLEYQPLATDNCEAEQIGRYRILERLGAGGMGTVYKAFDPGLDRVVALKLPRFDGNPEQLAKRTQRFQREARAAAKIWHPNVCPIYDVGEHNGQPFVVMALVEGQSLAQRLADRARFEDIAAATTVICQVLDGLETVHAHGILHRDLKPANILLDASGRAILTDFGLARTEVNADPITSEGVILGTPAYMAPEQASHTQDVGPGTDLYSLGVVFYQMLTGRLPFEGSALEILGKLLHELPTPPARHRPEIPPALEAIILKALARDPAARFANAREFREALPALAPATE